MRKAFCRGEHKTLRRAAQKLGPFKFMRYQCGRSAPSQRQGPWFDFSDSKDPLGMAELFVNAAIGATKSVYSTRQRLRDGEAIF